MLSGELGAPVMLSPARPRTPYAHVALKRKRPPRAVQDQSPGSAAGEQLMKGAELLAGMLQAYGVRHVFGVPGDTNICFYSALDALEDGPRHILARDER